MRWGGVLMLLGAAACGGALSTEYRHGATLLGPGVHDVRIRHGGRMREARVFVPAAARSGNALPLVLAFHGGGGNATQFATHSGLERLAARDGFIVVHPDGTGQLGLHTFNATSGCCGFALDRDVDDVGFTLALLDSLMPRVRYDADRVYATGHSNGALMSYRLAAEAGGRLAAIAPVAAAAQLEVVRRPGPMPVLHIQSVDDPRALYHGGVGPAFPLTQRRVDHPPVDSVLATWRDINGCRGEAVVTERRSGRAGTPDAGQHAERLEWRDCGSGAPVVHWRLHGVGHAWPGDAGAAVRAALVGRTTQLVSAAEEAWAFFQQHRRR
jgi:polyhydroxybutyrate depolymerase